MPTLSPVHKEFFFFAQLGDIACNMHLGEGGTIRAVDSKVAGAVTGTSERPHVSTVQQPGRLLVLQHHLQYVSLPLLFLKPSLDANFLPMYPQFGPLCKLSPRSRTGKTIVVVEFSQRTVLPIIGGGGSKTCLL